MDQEDDYNSSDDLVVPKSSIEATTEKLSRRKRKRQQTVQETANTHSSKRRKQIENDNENKISIKEVVSDTNADYDLPLNVDVKNHGKKGEPRKAKHGDEGGQTKLKSDTGPSINEAIAHMEARLMADYVSQRIRRFEKDISFIELEDKLLPERYFVDTSSFKPARSLDNMPQYMEIYCTKKGQSTISHLKSSPKNPGSPHTIVIAAAALRAADIVRQLRQYQTKDAAVAKFFAKHVKMKEAVEYAEKTRIGIAVGTPARLLDLLKDGALKTKYLQRIILDVSHIDQKKRGLFDMREVQEKVMELLAIEAVRKRLDGGDEDLGDRRGVMFY